MVFNTREAAFVFISSLGCFVFAFRDAVTWLRQKELSGEEMPCWEVEEPRRKTRTTNPTWLHPFHLTGSSSRCEDGLLVFLPSVSRWPLPIMPGDAAATLEFYSFLLAEYTATHCQNAAILTFFSFSYFQKPHSEGMLSFFLFSPKAQHLPQTEEFFTSCLQQYLHQWVVVKPRPLCWCFEASEVQKNLVLIWCVCMCVKMFVIWIPQDENLFFHFRGSDGASVHQCRHFSPWSNTVSCSDVTTQQAFNRSCLLLCRSCCLSLVLTDHPLTLFFQAQSNTMQLCTFCVARILSDTLVLIIISNVIFLCECFFYSDIEWGICYLCKYMLKWFRTGWF